MNDPLQGHVIGEAELFIAMELSREFWLMYNYMTGCSPGEWEFEQLQIAAIHL